MGKKDKLSFYSLRPQNVTHATGKITATSFCMFFATDMQKIILSESKLAKLQQPPFACLCN
jgi:hypothetical protein